MAVKWYVSGVVARLNARNVYVPFKSQDVAFTRTIVQNGRGGGGETISFIPATFSVCLIPSLVLYPANLALRRSLLLSCFNMDIARCALKFAAFKNTYYERYRDTLKSVTVASPDSSSMPSNTLFVRSLAPPLVQFKMRPKKHFMRRPYMEKEHLAKAKLNRIKQILNIKQPVTEDKLIRVMSALDVPIMKYTSARLEVICRKYLTATLKEFTEHTFKSAYFNSKPPFKPADAVNIAWESKLTGLLISTQDIENVHIKKPTERLTTIIDYCATFVNTAYKNLIEETASTPEEAFVKRIRRYNEYASLVNNVSSNLKYNASSLLFTYFNKYKKSKYREVHDTLADIRTGSRSVEDELLVHVLGSIAELDPKDPYDIVGFTGHPFEQIQPALRAEFLLLKLLFYFCRQHGVELNNFVCSNYGKKYTQQTPSDPFAINNVLQLFPGLMTIMFYIVGNRGDEGTAAIGEGVHQGRNLLRQLVHQFKVHQTTNYQAGRQEAIETHKIISKLIGDVAELCMNNIILGVVPQTDYTPYTNHLFMRSGILM